MTTRLARLLTYEQPHAWETSSGVTDRAEQIIAALAAATLRQPGPVTVSTSDEDHPRKLYGDRAAVTGL